MKNKHNRALCILMCIVLIASVFTACGIKDGGDTTTLAPVTGDGWQGEIPEDITYSKIVIEGVELADVITGALGEEYKDTNINELNDAEKDKLKDFATDKGYIVEEDKDGNLVIQKPVAEVATDVANELFTQASVKDPSNLTPEDITRLSQVAASNNMQLVTDNKGNVNIVEKVTIPPTTKATTAPTTQKQNNNLADYLTTMKNEIPQHNPPEVGDVASMGTTLPKTKVVNAGWLKTYGDGNHHIFSNNAVTSDGGVVAVGAMMATDGKGNSSKYGAVIAKYNDDGKLKWHETVSSDKIFQYEDVAVLKDGSIIAVGYSSGGSISGLTDNYYKDKKSVEGVVAKYSAKGEKIFTKIVGGSGSDMVYAVAATSDGGFIIGGKSDSVDNDLKGVGANKIKAFVMKMDANGNIVWKNALSSTAHSAVKNIAVAPNGTVYATIETVADDGDFAGLEGVKKGLETTVLIKLDKNGALGWKKSFYGSGRTQLYAVAATNDGCVIAGQYASGVNGNTGTFKDVYNGGNQGTFDGAVIKVGADGKQKWLKTLVGFQNDFISDIAVVPGGFALSGYTNSTNRDFMLKNNGEIDSFVYTISSYGELMTATSYGGSSIDNARSICSNGKTVYVAGFTNSADGSFLNSEVKGAEGKGAALVHQFNLETT